jgi:hypothetical protein
LSSVFFYREDTKAQSLFLFPFYFFLFAIPF